MQSNIIIIGDDKEIRNLIGIYLENEGMLTEKFADAIEAMKFLRDKFTCTTKR